MKTLLQRIDDMETDFRKRTILTILDNGLKVIVEKCESAPGLVKGNLYVPFGSKDEKPEHAGVAHLVEHMCYNGTKKYPTEEKINAIVKKIGYRPNAGTSKAHILFPFLSLNSDIDLTIDLISQLGFAATFPKDKMAKEKTTVINEIKRAYSNPYTAINDWSHDKFIKGFPFKHNPLGNPNAITKVDRDTLIDYRNRFMIPNGSYLTLIGNSNGSGIKNICKLLSKFKPGQIEETFIPEEPELNERIINKEKFEGISRAHIIYIFRTTKEDHVDNYNISIAEAILNVISNSRLYTALREREGLTYSIASGFATNKKFGSFMINFDVDQNNVSRAIKTLDAELIKLYEGSITDEEMEEAKKKLEIEVLDRMYGEGPASSFLFALEKDNFNRLDYIRNMVKATKKDIKRVVGQYLNPKKSMINIAYPK